jgi:hypothetical protein
MRFCSLVVLASGLLWLSSQPVAAGIAQYNYVGMPFAVTSGSPPPSVTNISGDFQFNQALVPTPTPAPDDITSLITAFSFTDGNQTLTKLNTPPSRFRSRWIAPALWSAPGRSPLATLQMGRVSRHFRFRRANAATTLPERMAIWPRSSALRVSIMLARGPAPYLWWAPRHLCLNRPLLPCLPEASVCSGSAGPARFAGANLEGAVVSMIKRSIPYTGQRLVREHNRPVAPTRAANGSDFAIKVS